jgi:hypothetical protein
MLAGDSSVGGLGAIERSARSEAFDSRRSGAAFFTHQGAAGKSHAGKVGGPFAVAM